MASINFENFESDLEVDISQRKDLNSDDLTRVLNAVNKNDQVEKINLSNHKFTPIKILLNFLNENLSKSKNLKEIRLENCFSSLNLNKLNNNELKILVSLYKNPNFRKIIFDKSTHQLINTLAMQALPIHSPEEIESDKNSLIELIPNFDEPNFNFDDIDPALYDVLAARIWNEDKEEPSLSSDPVIPPPDPKEQSRSNQEYDEDYSNEEFDPYDVEEEFKVEQKAEAHLDSTENEDSLDLDKWADEFIHSLVRAKNANAESNEPPQKVQPANIASSSAKDKNPIELEEDLDEKSLDKWGDEFINSLVRAKKVNSESNESPQKIQPKNVSSSSPNEEKYSEKNYRPAENSKDEKKLRQYLQACDQYRQDLKQTITKAKETNRPYHTAEKRLALVKEFAETIKIQSLNVKQADNLYRKLKHNFMKREAQFSPKEKTRDVKTGEMLFYKNMDDTKDALQRVRKTGIIHSAKTKKNVQSKGEKDPEELAKQKRELKREQAAKQRARMEAEHKNLKSHRFFGAKKSGAHDSSHRHKSHAAAHKKSSHRSR